jgi:alanine racemase
MIPTGKIRRFFKRKIAKYKPLVRVEISKAAIENNYRIVKDMTGMSVAPVLKSNAYGHGLIEVASIMKSHDIPFLIVDSLFEAIAIRKNGIKTKVLVIGYVHPDNLKNIHIRQVSYVATSLSQLQEMAGLNKEIRVHIKIDTGMSRQGVQMDQVKEALQLLKKNAHIKLEGICSHFGQGELPQSDRTIEQINRWNQVVKDIEHEMGEILYKHISATTGVQLAHKINQNIIRLGIGLYGVDPANKIKDRQEALHLRAPIVSIKYIEKGEWIGYGETKKAEKRMRLGILPLGYYEGLQRELSNKGAVYCNEIRLPIVGRISMNITAIDLTHAPQIQKNDIVSCIGGEHEETSIAQIAHTAKKIPYEVMVGVPQHLRRTIV